MDCQCFGGDRWSFSLLLAVSMVVVGTGSMGSVERLRGPLRSSPGMHLVHCLEVLLKH
jgi:hypothetical protein